MKPLAVSDKDYDMLKWIAVNIMHQGNRATAHPLYCVYQKKVVIVPEGHSDLSGWTKDGETVSTESVMEEIKKDCEAHPEQDHRTDDDIAEELGYEKYYYKLEDVPVSGQVYLTEMAAQAHIDANHYHYKNPFIYVESAWRNLEMQNLRRIICALFNMEAPT